MAIVTGLTAERMAEIEAASVVDGEVVGNDLVLYTRDGWGINAGDVRGPTGPTGSAALTEIWVQSSPASTWVINHSLIGDYPVITIVDSAGTEVIGDVQYTSTTQIIVTFASAFSGKAYLN